MSRKSSIAAGTSLDVNDDGDDDSSVEFIFSGNAEEAAVERVKMLSLRQSKPSPSTNSDAALAGRPEQHQDQDQYQERHKAEGNRMHNRNEKYPFGQAPPSPPPAAPPGRGSTEKCDSHMMQKKIMPLRVPAAAVPPAICTMQEKLGVKAQMRSDASSVLLSNPANFEQRQLQQQHEVCNDHLNTTLRAPSLALPTATDSIEVADPLPPAGASERRQGWTKVGDQSSRQAANSGCAPSHTTIAVPQMFANLNDMPNTTATTTPQVANLDAALVVAVAPRRPANNSKLFTAKTSLPTAAAAAMATEGKAKDAPAAAMATEGKVKESESSQSMTTNANNELTTTTTDTGIGTTTNAAKPASSKRTRKRSRSREKMRCDYERKEEESDHLSLDSVSLPFSKLDGSNDTSDDDDGDENESNLFKSVETSFVRDGKKSMAFPARLIEICMVGSPYDRPMMEENEPLFDELSSVFAIEKKKSRREGVRPSQKLIRLLNGNEKAATALIAMYLAIDHSKVTYSSAWLEGSVEGNPLTMLPNELMLLCLQNSRLANADSAVVQKIVVDLGVYKICARALKTFGITDDYPRLLRAFTKAGLDLKRTRALFHCSNGRIKRQCQLCAIFLSRTYQCALLQQQEILEESLAKKIRVCLGVMEKHYSLTKPRVVEPPPRRPSIKKRKSISHMNGEKKSAAVESIPPEPAPKRHRTEDSVYMDGSKEVDSLSAPNPLVSKPLECKKELSKAAAARQKPSMFPSRSQIQQALESFRLRSLSFTEPTEVEEASSKDLKPDSLSNQSTEVLEHIENTSQGPAAWQNPSDQFHTQQALSISSLTNSTKANNKPTGRSDSDLPLIAAAKEFESSCAITDSLSSPVAPGDKKPKQPAKQPAEASQSARSGLKKSAIASRPTTSEAKELSLKKPAKKASSKPEQQEKKCKAPDTKIPRIASPDINKKKRTTKQTISRPSEHSCGQITPKPVQIGAIASDLPMVELCRSSNGEVLVVFEDIHNASEATEMNLGRILERIQEGPKPHKRYYYRFSKEPRRAGSAAEVEKLLSGSLQLIATFHSISFAARDAKMDESAMRGLLKDGPLMHGGFIWRTALVQPRQEHYADVNTAVQPNVVGSGDIKSEHESSNEKEDSIDEHDASKKAARPVAVDSSYDVAAYGDDAKSGSNINDDDNNDGGTTDQDTLCAHLLHDNSNEGGGGTTVNGKQSARKDAIMDDDKDCGNTGYYSRSARKDATMNDDSDDSDDENGGNYYTWSALKTAMMDDDSDGDDKGERDNSDSDPAAQIDRAQGRSFAIEMVCLDTKRVLKTFQTQSAVSDFLNMPRTSFRQRFKGGGSILKGYLWRYKANPMRLYQDGHEPIPVEQSGPGRGDVYIIDQIDPSTNKVVSTFFSQKSVTKHLKMHPDIFRERMRDGQAEINGYLWRYQPGQSRPVRKARPIEQVSLETPAKVICRFDSQVAACEVANVERMKFRK